MKNSQTPDLNSLIKKEGWEIVEDDGVKKVIAFGQEFPVVHPIGIYNKLYRTEKNPETKYLYMKAIHDIYWPQLIPTWNYWTERRFRAHCEGYSFISMAGGASKGKSNDAALIAIINWLSDPANNAVIVASTTLQALSKRIWGYIVRYIHAIKIPIQFHYTKSPSPQIVFDKKDEIHSMSAMAAAVGTDEESIKNYIGRHPNKKFMLILDEAPDLSPYVLKAVANLEAGEDGKLQVMVIGNSLSKSDLHGALSTPKNGWRSIDYRKDSKWQTTQPNGVCLYFSPFDSPAIHETDPVKRALLSKFLITAEQIEEKKQRYGENSLEYWRMVLGFWQDQAGGTSTFTDKPFLDTYAVRRKSLWSGLHPLNMCGGFDPAFSTGGDSAILRLAVLGHIQSGPVVLDFRDNTLVFKLKMEAVHKDPIEIQLADQIIVLLSQYKCPLENVAFDVTGQGRTFPELVRLRAAQKGIHWKSGIKVYSSRSSANKNNQDVIVKSPTELWDNLKEFVQTNQIAGLDDMAIYQLTTRLLVVNPKTKKRELESKLDYRNRMSAINPGKGGSPDQADSASLAVFAAIYRHGFYKEQAKAVDEPIDFFSQKFNALNQAEAVEQKPVAFKFPKATFTGELGAKLKGPSSRF